VIVGIDPGKTGALAALDGDGHLVAVHDMPDSPAILAHLLRDWTSQYGVVAAWVEKVASRPGQGVSSTFKFGVGYGQILGVLAAVGIPTHHVTPSVWKKAAHLSADKTASRVLACELWPDCASAFARIKDDGRAEAALIARHGWLDWRQG